MSSSDQQYPYPYEPRQQPPVPPQSSVPQSSVPTSPVTQPQPHQPAQQHWPDGTAGQSALPQEPGSFDQGATQTWQAPTWDTQYQPTIRRDAAPQGYGQPEPDAYGAPRPVAYGAGAGAYGDRHGSGSYGDGQGAGAYGDGQGSGAYGMPQPSQPYQAPQQRAQYGEPQYQEGQEGQYGQPQSPQPYQHPQHQGRPQPPAAQPEHQPHQPVPSAADTAYLPPQGASGSLPLPPEAPAQASATPAPASQAPAQPQAARLDDSGYSAPTTLGNARITDAQRARAEGRSPIIAPGMQPAALTAGLGLLLAGGAAIGTYALLVPLVLLQALTAAGWFRLNGMWPARQGIALAFAGGLVADVALLTAGREHGPAALVGTLGVWVLLTVVLQLRSHAAADERLYGLMATVVSAALAVLAAGHLAAAGDAVVVGGVAVAAAVLARALPLPGVASVVVALLAGAGAGVATGGLTEYGGQGALLGLAAGVCALIGLRVASYDYPSRFVHMTAGVALPLTAAAPAVYLIGRALV
ncbi:hypothetical protein ACMZ5F_10200 [Streptomyces rhizosphaericola]|uniref:hypothetical protein n=1 Tax=Streptomyces rhizosphaericola TaxID=2564098 RepID=UPI0039EE4095